MGISTRLRRAWAAATWSAAGAVVRRGARRPLEPDDLFPLPYGRPAAG